MSWVNFFNSSQRPFPRGTLSSETTTISPTCEGDDDADAGTLDSNASNSD